VGRPARPAMAVLERHGPRRPALVLYVAHAGYREQAGQRRWPCARRPHRTLLDLYPARTARRDSRQPHGHSHRTCADRFRRDRWLMETPSGSRTPSDPRTRGRRPPTPPSTRPSTRAAPRPQNHRKHDRR
jgi:hypothetical protein